MRAMLKSFALGAIAVGIASPGARAQERLSPEYRARAEAVAARADAYLREQQDASGGWRTEGRGAQFPAISALALNAITQHTSEANVDDDAIRRAVAFLLAKQQPDGGIYGQVLPNYNTSCAVSALSRIHTPEARDAVERAQQFLLSLQWGAPQHPQGPAAGEKEAVGEDHPFYGGVGYGGHSRPDLSNLQFMLQALDDSGYESDGPAVKRALKFLERVQMYDEINPMEYADGSKQGGFVYATGPEGDQPRAGESKTAMIEETLDDGAKVSRLRAYGSMTYAGFKGYVYAQLPRDDIRVRAALDWLQHNYTLDENPGMGQEGYYYFILVFGRAMDAWDEPTILTISQDGSSETRYWAHDLVEALEARQLEDGSFRLVDDRWMEGDPVLITSYALIGLRAAMAE